MLPKLNRVTHPTEFRNIMRKSRKTVRPGVVIYTRNWDGISQFGVIAPNKVFTNAVKRNRAKRLVREWFAAEMKTHPTGRKVVVRITDADFRL